MRATARKAAVAVAGTVLAIGTLAACGGDGGSGSAAPDDASQEDFCDAFAALYEDILAQALSDDPAVSVQAIKDWAERMSDVGTPEDMPDEAREGFEVFVDAARDLPEDATLEDLESFGDDLPEADRDAGDAFGDWSSETCKDELVPDMGDLPSEVPSDLPTDDLPTELPSDLESMMSELPSDLESLLSEMPTDPAELESMLSELGEAQ